MVLLFLGKFFLASLMSTLHIFVFTFWLHGGLNRITFSIIKRYYLSIRAILLSWLQNNRSSRSEVFLVKGVLKICSKFTGEYPCRSVISIKLQSNFIEIALRHGCSPVNLLHIFRTPFTNWRAAPGIIKLYFYYLTFHVFTLQFLREG